MLSAEGLPKGERQYDYSSIPGPLQNELEFKLEGFRRRIMGMMNSAEGNAKNRLYSNIHSYKNFNFRLMILPKVKLTSVGSLEGHISAYLEAVPSPNWPSNWVWLNTRYSVTLINQKDYRKSHFMSDLFSFKGENDPNNRLSLEERNSDYSSAGPEADRGWSDFFSLKTLLDPKTGFIDPETETVIFRAGAFPALCDPVSFGRASLDSMGTDRSLTGYVGIRNLGATCYMNSLLQSLYHIGRFRKAVYTIPLNPNRTTAAGTSCSNTPISRETRVDSLLAGHGLQRVEDIGDATPHSNKSEANGLTVSLLGEASEDVLEWTSAMAKSLFEYDAYGAASLESIMSSNACQDYGQGTGMPSNDQTRISSALQTLFYELQTCCEPVNCRELMRAFGWDAADAFTQHDAQELNRLLCDRLEEEMKNTAVDGVIKALFEGEYENYIECLDVDCTSRRRENFYDIQVDVEGVGSLEESLERFVEEEILDGENLYEAEGFGKQRAKKGVRFQRFPPVVQFHLKRFQFNIQSMDMVKLNDHFTFPEKLDLSEFVSHGGKEDADQQMGKDKGTEKYILHTVVIHQGDVHSGHYYAYIRPKPDSDWFRFDDEKVTLVSSSTAIEDNFGGHDYETQDPLRLHPGLRPGGSGPGPALGAGSPGDQPGPGRQVQEGCRDDEPPKETATGPQRARQSPADAFHQLQHLSALPPEGPRAPPEHLVLPLELHLQVPQGLLPLQVPLGDRKEVPRQEYGSHQHRGRGGTGGPLHHAGVGAGGLSSPGLSFYTCISSPGDVDGSGGQVPDSQKGAAGILSRAIGFGAPSPGPGVMGRTGEETLLSELCRRYHRAGIWDSSCPTLYMCLYLDDISSLLMDRIPPSLSLISDGAYLERRQRVESKLRRWDEDGGGEVLLLLRYFDISDPRVGEICSKYTRTQEIPNLYNLGLVMVSQGTTLHDLNEYVAMEIDKERERDGQFGAAGTSGFEFGLRHRAAAAAGQRVESDFLGQPGGRRNQQKKRGAQKVTGGGGIVSQQQPVAPGGEDPGLPARRRGGEPRLQAPGRAGGATVPGISGPRLPPLV
ncbi:ubiquitin carboxyl terminal hydrolase domain that is fused to a MATH domain [Cryptosporidium canis]|uniref:Ubiquitin carboxyl terminal hydrolase domain that is fused to a MATH domain n=1 Tax=Cryptosporidium canis TaxID=195482 RepID=A0A9D5DH80_9CRYT|nr:ubiquitin carboxyl terminal hydrolase domain that is fused to a MATH domain [Cryptosporidium canis]